MFQIEHLNLVVKDIPAALKFYQAAFPHWRVRGGGENEWYGKPRKWIHFGDDYQYLSLNDNGVEHNRDLKGHQVGLAHFAFVTNDIKGMITRLQNAGFEIAIEGGDDPYRDNVYFIDPDAGQTGYK